MADRHADGNDATTAEYKETIRQIMTRLQERHLTRDEAAMEVMDRIDMEFVLDSEDELLSAAYWAVRHLVGECGFETTDTDIRYLLECLSGTEQYSEKRWREYYAEQGAGS